jgi:DNA-binding MarR family transcriptional regulator
MNLAEVAAREVAAARANGVYTVTWDKLERINKRNDRARAVILRNLERRGELTTRMIARYLSGAAENAHQMLCKLEAEGLVKRRVKTNRSGWNAYWRLVE